MRPLLLRATRWLAFALLLLALAAIRVHCAASGELSAARRAAAAGDTDQALTRYGRAVRWRLPGPLAGPSDRAATAMHDLARLAASASGNPALAERAQRELRGALLGARWLTPPHRGWLAEANHLLAQALAERDAARGNTGSLAARERALTRIPGPPPLQASVAVLLFIGFLAAGLLFALELGRPRATSTTGIGATSTTRRTALTGAATLLTLLGWQLALATLEQPLALAIPASFALAVALAALCTGVFLTLRARPLQRLLGAALTLVGTLATLACTLAALRPGFF